jgi:hypothetical protein
MATLRARRRSRSSRPIRFALVADGFMPDDDKLKKTLEDEKRRVNSRVDLGTFKVAFGAISIFDSWRGFRPIYPSLWTAERLQHLRMINGELRLRLGTHSSPARQPYGAP